MRYFKNKITVVFLIFILVFYISIFGIFGSERVRAGFWDDNKDSIFTVVKGMIMLWILNLMRENIGAESDDDIISSAIKNSIDLNNESEPGIDKKEKDDTLISSDNDEKIINNDYVTDKEFEMLKLLNQVRQKEGLDLLEIDMELARVARRKAVDMINNNYFDHNSPSYGTAFDMIKSENIDYSLAGENLAESALIEDAFKSLMESEEHKANILNSRYDSVGIGVVENDNGGLVIVQLFIDSPDPTE